MTLSDPPSDASIRTLERMGMVLRRSTTDCTWDRQRSSVARSIVAFIGPYFHPSRAHRQIRDRIRLRAPEIRELSLAVRSRGARTKVAVRRFLGDKASQDSIAMPPLTCSVCPVTYPASLEAR